MHVKDITITFGYILYDMSIVTVSLYEGQILVPGSVTQEFIFGIRQVNSQSQLAGGAGRRRLQVVDRAMIPSAKAPSRAYKATSKKELSVPVISAIDPSNVAPTIVKRSIQANKSKVLPYNASTVNSAVPSRTAQLLRNTSRKGSIIVKPINVNSDLYS